MSFPQFKTVRTFSNRKVARTLSETEKNLFDLEFKKATRQTFKPHEIQYAKRRIAQLKTLLTLRLDLLERRRTNTVNEIIKEQYYKKQNS